MNKLVLILLEYELILLLVITVRVILIDVRVPSKTIHKYLLCRKYCLMYFG